MAIETTGINIFNHLTGKYKKVATTGGGEWAGACPFCGGEDRFRVFPNAQHGARWWCRQCDRKGDVISLLQERDGLTFVEAVTLLGLDGQLEQKATTVEGKHKAQPAQPETHELQHYAALDNQEWQAAAWQYVRDSIETFWDAQTPQALHYLTVERGLPEWILESAGVGYNTEARQASWGGVDVYLPRGIVLPWVVDGVLWNVRHRLPPGGEHKYTSVKGCANGLYGVEFLRAGANVVLVEGELDALSARAAMQDAAPFGAVATGGATHARVQRWIARALKCKTVLLAFDRGDTDKAGDKAAAWWAKQLGNTALRWQPTLHDINDMLRADADGLFDWLMTGFTSAMAQALEW